MYVNLFNASNYNLSDLRSGVNSRLDVVQLIADRSFKKKRRKGSKVVYGKILVKNKYLRKSPIMTK